MNLHSASDIKMQRKHTYTLIKHERQQNRENLLAKKCIDSYLFFRSNEFQVHIINMISQKNSSLFIREE
jgi:hypothetical protein